MATKNAIELMSELMQSIDAVAELQINSETVPDRWREQAMNRAIDALCEVAAARALEMAVARQAKGGKS